MTHILPPHADLNLAPSSLQSALQMDPNHQNQQIQQHQQQIQQHQQAQQPAVRKRKKNDSNGDESVSPSEPRRLRRSHEACARCRSKKIKCDSKHPRCTACNTAGVPCHQEDRHRQTLTPRGHTEHIEHQLKQCEALLRRQYPGFDIKNLDEFIAREGIDINEGADGPHQPPGQQAPKGYPYPPPQHMVPPGYPMPMHYAGPPGAPYPPPMHMGPGQYNPHIHPAFQHHPPPHMAHPVPMQVLAPPPSHDIKGQDPNANDMSNTQALAKNFGVSAAIVSDLKLAPATVDREDLGVGSSALTSGRDRPPAPPLVPRDTVQWVSVSIRRNSLNSPPPIALEYAVSHLPSVAVWLPRDRKMVNKVVDIYFTRLNIHRPIFYRAEFENTLDALYDGQNVQHDPGYIVSLYLILALGTLSYLNHRATAIDTDGEGSVISSSVRKKLMPADWPEQEEFFEHALAAKPDLRVTISSLQALILLQWYLYTERQGRTLWRLVGSLVRVAIELGLHHDPMVQGNTFTPDECQLRIRLWSIVMVHDRGTSILLGRPLGIAPADSNTPRPTRSKNGQSDFSDHFLLSSPIAEIQADIINSLYIPTRQSGDAIMRHATRIIKSMSEFRRQLPDPYQWFFSGTEDWSIEKRTQLVHDITEDQGLTLLKIGISRILLLRALFNAKELSYHQRYKALVDAIVTSHNIIIVHNTMIRFPDIAFMTSPIPLHIAAMVILYGHMSHCDRLPRQVALEDVWMALDMLPRFRWRWERHDFNGGHPLIAKLAERVLEVNLSSVGPAREPVLLPEQDWDIDNAKSPSLSAGALKSQQSTPTMPPATSYPASHGSQPRNANSSSGHVSTTNHGGNHSHGPDGKELVDVPTGLFYPFYPEDQSNLPDLVHGSSVGNNNGHQDYSHLLAAAASQPHGGFQPSHGSYMLEEKDTSHSNGMPMWMNVQAARGMPSYTMPPA